MAVGWRDPRPAEHQNPVDRQRWLSLQAFLADPAFKRITLQGNGTPTYNPTTDVTVPPPSVTWDGSTAFLPGPNSITTLMLQANAVTIAKLAVDSVGTAQLVASAVTAVKVATDAITTTKILDGSITTPKVVAGAITSNEIAAGAIIAGKITAGTIVAADIASAAITTVKLAAGAVTANEIAAGAIIASKIGANEVTAGKLATNIALVAGFISSTTYVAGTSGWKIDSSGSAEFNNVTVRGDIVFGGARQGIAGESGGAIYGSTTSPAPASAPQIQFDGNGAVYGYNPGGLGFSNPYSLVSLGVVDAEQSRVFGIEVLTTSAVNALLFTLPKAVLVFGGTPVAQQFRFTLDPSAGYYIPALYKALNNANTAVFVYGEQVVVTTDGSGYGTVTYTSAAFLHNTLSVVMNSMQNDSVTYSVVSWSAAGFVFLLSDPATAAALPGRTETISYIALGY